MKVVGTIIGLAITGALIYGIFWAGGKGWSAATK